MWVLRFFLIVRFGLFYLKKLDRGLSFYGFDVYGKTGFIYVIGEDVM